MLRAMRALARHWGLLLILAATAPLMVAFTRGHGLASMSDDSVSYLMVARWIAGDAREFIAPWLPWHTHFGPLFPMALAAAGASHDLARAHVVVAIFAIAAVASIYRFVLAATGRRDAAAGVAALFMLTPTAWLSAKGILSEPLYLVVSMEALRFHALRMQDRAARVRDALALGGLLGLAYLTRSAAVALLLAYAVHSLVGLRRGRDWGAWLALIVPIGMASAWVAVRPHGAGDIYARTLAEIIEAWKGHPAVLAELAPHLVFGGWVSSFTGVAPFAQDAPVALGARCALAVLASFALAGAAMRARRNALDGWYVLATLVLLLFWIFDEENMRRLLYPVLPLLLMHAGVALAALCRRIGQAARARLALALAAAVVPALSVPPLLAIASKARDTAPFLEGHPGSASDITDYFLTPNIEYSRAIAARHAAILAAFEMIAATTPPGSRVMYVRPEYVALLANRAGERLDYAWDDLALASAVQSSGAGYILATSLAKTDLAHKRGDAMACVAQSAPYTRRALVLSNEKGRDEVVLLEVDREALARFLARGG
jgi:hypothetical protein